MGSYQSPFDIGRQVGASFAPVIRQGRDQGTIQNILAEAQASGDPQVLQNSIGRILSSVSPENQGAAVQYLQNMMQTSQKKQEQQQQFAREKEAGLVPGINPTVQAAIYKEGIKKQALQDYYGGGEGQLPGAATGEGLPGQQAQPRSVQQLIRDTGSPYREISEPAKAQLQQYQEEAKIKQKQSSDVFKADLDRSQKVLKESDEIASQLPQKESSLNLMNEALANKDLSFWSWDNFADKTGVEAFRSPEGALFKTAAKEYFLGNIKRAGARPNQWIEQQIQDMLAKIGRSTGANLTVTRALENELDLDKKRVELANDISERLRSEGDYSQGNLGRLVQKELSKYAEDRQQVLYNDLRAIKSIEEKKPQSFYKVKQGTPVSDYMVQSLIIKFNGDRVKARKEAQKLGYSIE
jgi:hypothetical protein